MYPFIETPITGTTLFHHRACDLPIPSSGNDRIPKRHAAIRRFLAAVGQLPAEVRS
jgi:hypothetical protein